MKISLKWLKDYIKFNIPVEKLAHRLTMAGMEIEKINSVDGDSVLEMEITPNRPDCLNVIGIAREVAAVLNKPLIIPKVRKRRLPSAKADVAILDHEGCLRYIGVLIKNVSVGKAPDSMAKRLSAIGLRPINNIVDITNFCLMETGQPMHAFDHDKLVGGKIVARRARQGEKIVTIDGVERVLDPSILVIADAKRPVAVAGVMGGQDTEVTEKTKNILLESAYFDPVLVRRGARKLGLSTDSSYRFERGVNIQMVEGAAHRAIALIREFSQGETTHWTDLFLTKRKISKSEISIKIQQVNDLLGSQLTYSRCKTILKKLEFYVKGENRDTLHVQAPDFRGDIEREVDVIEEIGRVIGYDNLPMSLPQITVAHLNSRNNRQLKKEMRDILNAQGFNEVITYTLINSQALEKTKQADLKRIKVKNPLTQDQEIMRPDLLPGLLGIALSNINRGQKNMRLYELGKKYLPEGEKEFLAMIVTGLKASDWRHFSRGKMDFFDIKGPASILMERLRVKKAFFEDAAESPIYEPGRDAVIKVGQTVLGNAGQIKKEILRKWEIKFEDIYFLQLSLAELAKKRQMAVGFEPISEYPAITRDVSLAVKEDVSFAQIEKTAFQLGAKFLKEINFMEVYRGEKIPQGHKGLSFSLRYQSSKRTLTEEEISEVHATICQSYIDHMQAIIR